MLAGFSDIASPGNKQDLDLQGGRLASKITSPSVHPFFGIKTVEGFFSGAKIAITT